MDSRTDRANKQVSLMLNTAWMRSEQAKRSIPTSTSPALGAAAGASTGAGTTTGAVARSYRIEWWQVGHASVKAGGGCPQTEGNNYHFLEVPARLVSSRINSPDLCTKVTWPLRSTGVTWLVGLSAPRVILITYAVGIGDIYGAPLLGLASPTVVIILCILLASSLYLRINIIL